MITRSNEEERREAHEVLRQLKRFYWDVLKDIRGSSVTESEDIEGLAKYLPAEDDGEEYNQETSKPSDNRTKDETAKETPTKEGQVVILTPGRPPTTQTPADDGGYEPGETGSGRGESSGGDGDVSGGDGSLTGAGTGSTRQANST